MITLTYNMHYEAWLLHWKASDPAMRPDYPTMINTDEDSLAIARGLADLAMTQALAYVGEHPEARILKAAPLPPRMYEGWPPAQPADEPPMDDGSHLLASEAGRRRIDPETGKRMIRTMVLTEHAWPHWEWTEDVEGPEAVGPWGPDVSIGTPEQPTQISPSASMRPHARAGRQAGPAAQVQALAGRPAAVAPGLPSRQGVGLIWDRDGRIDGPAGAGQHGGCGRGRRAPNRVLRQDEHERRPPRGGAGEEGGGARGQAAVALHGRRRAPRDAGLRAEQGDVRLREGAQAVRVHPEDGARHRRAALSFLLQDDDAEREAAPGRRRAR